MKRQQTYAALDPIASADLNTWQDKTLGGRAAGVSNDYGATTVYGSDVVRTQLTTSVADATLKNLDASIDWRDRVLRVTCSRLNGTNERLGQSLDYETNDPLAGTVAKLVTPDLYTGIGAYSNLTTGAAVSNGNPPLNGAGVYRSYAPVIDDLSAAGNVTLYADPSTGALNLYNATGGAVWLRIEIEAAGDTGLR